MLPATFLEQLCLWPEAAGPYTALHHGNTWLQWRGINSAAQADWGGADDRMLTMVPIAEHQIFPGLGILTGIT